MRYAPLPARGTVEAASRCEIMALLLPLIVLAAFFLLRNPQRRRAQAQKTLLESLQPGTRVATVAGVIGTLVGTEGDRAAIEIAPGVIVEFLLASITRTIDEPVPEPVVDLDAAEEHAATDVHEATEGHEATEVHDATEVREAADEAAPHHEET